MARNANDTDTQEVKAQLQRLTEAVLNPLAGKATADISPELKERVESFVAQVQFPHASCVPH